MKLGQIIAALQHHYAANKVFYRIDVKQLPKGDAKVTVISDYQPDPTMIRICTWKVVNMGVSLHWECTETLLAHDASAHYVKPEVTA